MRIGIVGSGVADPTIGAKLVACGQDVVLGTRSRSNQEDKRGMGAPSKEWLDKTGNKGCIASFADTAAHGEIVINATSGMASLEARPSRSNRQAPPL